MPAELRFRAMGSACRLVVDGGDENAAIRAQARIEELERRWSRFDPTSEVSRLNRSAGLPAVVSVETFELIAAAMDAHAATGGLFDPLLLRELELLGYDRSHELLAEPPAFDARWSVEPALDVLPTPLVPSSATHDVQIDRASLLVWMPEGVAFDPGGIGKGLAADWVADQLVSDGADWVVVELGGDVRVAGSRVAHWGAEVELVDPVDRRVAARVRVHQGGVATSSRVRRRWSAADGSELHHLIDPRLGTSAESDLNTVTVMAPTTRDAEVLAKAVLIAGRTAGTKLLLRHRVDGVLMDTGGRLHVVRSSGATTPREPYARTHS